MDPNCNPDAESRSNRSFPAGRSALSGPAGGRSVEGTEGVIRLRLSVIPRPGSRHEVRPAAGPEAARQPETSPDGGRLLAARVSGLVKTYGGRTAVAGIDFEIRRGEIFALLGPNGAGKTTTVEILEGYRARDDGQVSVLGYDPGRERARLKSRIGVVLQSTGVEPYLTVAETVTMYAGPYPHPRPVEEVLDLVGLADRRGDRVVRLRARPRRWASATGPECGSATGCPPASTHRTGWADRPAQTASSKRTSRTPSVTCTGCCTGRSPKASTWTASRSPGPRWRTCTWR